jgi:type VI protein secretion system component VasK
VALLPFELESADERELQDLIDFIRIDARSIRDMLRLRFPMTGLVVGMEKAKGFVEFIQSLDPDDVQRRLGARFDVRRRATAERLHRLSDGICDNFERFVYTHFDGHEALWQPENNRKLYALLCRIRERLKPKLNIVLRKAFGESDLRPAHRETGFESGEPPPVFFSGCYLAATGSRPDEQAFIKSVLYDKLVEEQGRVEWTAEAQRTHLLFKIAVWVGWALLLLGVVTLAAVISEIGR